MLLETTTPQAYSEIIDTISMQPDQGSRVGGTKEKLGVTVHSPNPRQRLLMRDNYNLAFALQERVAYWLGQNPGHVERYNSTMERFVNDEGVMPGSAYGTRFRHEPHDQIQRVLDALRENPESRRQIINVHQSGVENYDGNDVACTIYLQPFIRDDVLHMFADLRSQDMLWGYPYDTQAFQWIQEMMASILGVGVGEYWHRMNSCHYYTEREDEILLSARNYEFDTITDVHRISSDPTGAIAVLESRLEQARNGDMPRTRDLPQPFKDWLRVMLAYEQHRFHGADDSLVTDIADDIERDKWRVWVKNKL